MNLVKLLLPLSLSLLSFDNPKTDGIVFNRYENEPYLIESMDATFSDGGEFSFDALVSTYDLNRNGIADHIASYKILKRTPEKTITDSAAFYLMVDLNEDGNYIIFRDNNWDGILEDIDFGYEEIKFSI